jgi:large subunit ribosomal protein L15
MDLSTVHNGVHRMKLKKRVGRGIGSGHGKTSSRGSKGQGSRAGAKKPHPLSEGGQMQLLRRIPKRGFNQNTWRKKYVEVNVGDLDPLFKDGDNIDHESLKKAGLANGPADGIRILGNGELTKKLFITAHHFSKSAKEKIEAKNGKVTLVHGPKAPARNKMRPRPPKQQQT